MIYFGSNHITRKVITAFMEFFSNISIQKYQMDDQGAITPLKRVRVPVMWASAEKYLQQLRSGTNLRVFDPEERAMRPLEIERALPRMGVMLTSMDYDAMRHIPKTSRISDYNSNTGTSTSIENVYAPVPYNLMVDVSIIAKHLNEALEILEQIIPYFSPSMSIDVKVLDDREADSIPVVLQSIATDFYDEISETDDRFFIFLLTFNIKANYYLPKRIDSTVDNIQASLYADGSLDVMNQYLMNAKIEVAP